MTPQSICADLVRRSRSTFASAFRTLDPGRRDALEAIYAFCRHTDDLVDEATDPASAERALEDWREDVRRAFAGDPRHPLLQALLPHIRRYALSTRDFDSLLDGVAMDLTMTRYETFADLRRYCDGVAGSVGRIILTLLRGDEPRLRPYASDLGAAVQLTNILRDIPSDLRRGRCYLPREDLRRFDVVEEALARGVDSPRVRDLLVFECARARALFEKAEAGLLPWDCAPLFPAQALGAVYRALLRKIELAGLGILRHRVCLGSLEKSATVGRLWLRTRLYAYVPS